MPALQIDTPAPSVPAQRISLFWYPTGKCIRNGGRDTLKANECFLSDAPPGKGCADRMGNSSPGKECADRMGDSSPGKEGQRGSAMPKAGNPAKRELDQPAEAAGKEAGNRERKKKNSGSYMQSIYAEHSVAGAKISEKIFRKIVDNALFVCYD